MEFAAETKDAAVVSDLALTAAPHFQPAHPPLPGPRVSIGIGKAIVVEVCAGVRRRTIWKRIAGQQAQYGWAALKQLLH